MKPDFTLIKKILCFMEMSEIKVAIGFLKETEKLEEIYKHLLILREFDEMYRDLLKEYAKQGIIPPDNVVKI